MNQGYSGSGSGAQPAWGANNGQVGVQRTYSLSGKTEVRTVSFCVVAGLFPPRTSVIRRWNRPLTHDRSSLRLPRSLDPVEELDQEAGRVPQATRGSKRVLPKVDVWGHHHDRHRGDDDAAIYVRAQLVSESPHDELVDG